MSISQEAQEARNDIDRLVELGFDMAKSDNPACQLLGATILGIAGIMLSGDTQLISTVVTEIQNHTRDFVNANSPGLRSIYKNNPWNLN